MDGPPEGYELQQRIRGVGWGDELFHALAPDGQGVCLRRSFLRGDLPHLRRRRNHDDSREEQHWRETLEHSRTLRHPFLIQTSAYWVERGWAVVVTEWADGSLQDWLRECRRLQPPGIPPVPLVSYFGEAAEALDFLHAHGVVHRCLKPANLLCLDGHAKVDCVNPRLVPRGETATIAGVPAYMAPEQWNGQPVSRFSDQYSLARIYHEARSGQRSTPDNRMDLALQALQGPGPDLSGIPEAEQRVLRRALARLPEQRYPSCRALVRALTAVVAPGCAPPGGAADRKARAAQATRWRRWNDGTAAQLARAIAEANRFEDLPILGDALEDAGCTDEAILRHCRGPGPHVRGCWVLGLLLGKG
jgi:serine/threonine-protein kinase